VQAGEADVSRRLAHGGNPVTRWMASNVAVAQDPAGNLKPAKDKSTERIDGTDHGDRPRHGRPGGAACRVPAVLGLTETSTTSPHQYNAPADFVETVNAIGLPRYVKQAVDQQFARWGHAACAVQPAADLHPATDADQGQAHNVDRSARVGATLSRFDAHTVTQA
jgi:hypothetical protein